MRLLKGCLMIDEEFEEACEVWLHNRMDKLGRKASDEQIAKFIQRADHWVKNKQMLIIDAFRMALSEVV